MNQASMNDMPEDQHRIFVNAVNSVLGQSVVEILRNDNENDINPHIIVGTLDEEDPTPACRGIKRLINNKDPNELLRVILDCDVIIYDVTKSNFDEINFVIKALKSFNYQTQKVFILVSSILSWSETPQKDMIDERTGEAIEINSVITGKTGRTGITEKTIDIKDPKSNYNESEYTYRRCLPCYEYIKRLENQTLIAGKEKENLHTYVLCAGMVYGHGEDTLYDLFETAFEGKDPLTLIGEGKNSIPMIHCDDLASMVKYLVFYKPLDYSYIHAIDHASSRSQFSILKAISQSMGDTEIKRLSYLDAIYCYSYNLLTLNINLLPSELFNTEAIREGEDESEESSSSKMFRFKWKYRGGLVENFNKVFEEFKLYRAIKTFRIMVTGMPMLGKTYYAKHLAAYFKLPYIQIDELLQQVKEMDNEIGRELVDYLASEKERMVREAREQLDKDRAKKKKNLPEDINEDDYIPVLSKELINKTLKWRISRSDCLNKGYLLDSFPLAYSDAKQIFLERVVTRVIPELPPQPEGTDPETVAIPEPKEVITFEPINEIIPDKAFKFEVEDEDKIAEYLQSVLPEDQKNLLEEGGKFSEDAIEARFETYKKSIDGTSEEEKNGIFKFLMNSQREIVSINPLTAKYKSPEDFVKFCCDKLNTDYSFKASPAQEDVAGDNLLDAAPVHKEKEDNEDQVAKNTMEEDSDERIKEIMMQEQEILNRKSQALKQYITDNILPVLTSGLIEICNSKPDSPLDFLADYLIKRSLES